MLYIETTSYYADIIRILTNEQKTAKRYHHEHQHCALGRQSQNCQLERDI